MYLNINRIEFMTTYRCTGRCKHCSAAGVLNTGDYRHVNAEYARKAITQLTERFDIDSMMTFGGEPLLYSDVVCAIHSHGADKGIPKRQLITNGYFTKDEAKIRDTARALYQSGINNILLSVDAFHQETIPVGIVHTFARFLLDTGIGDVRLHPAWVVDAEHDNPYNAATRDILNKFSDLNIPVSDGNNIFLAGNAAKHLAQYYERASLDLSVPCGQMPYTDPLTDIHSISIVPNGDVMVCHFAIGNIYTDDIDAILTRYDPYANIHMKTIMSHGVQGLFEMAAGQGLDVDISETYSVCEACRALTQALSGMPRRG